MNYPYYYVCMIIVNKVLIFVSNLYFLLIWQYIYNAYRYKYDETVTLIKTFSIELKPGAVVVAQLVKW